MAHEQRDRVRGQPFAAAGEAQPVGRRRPHRDTQLVGVERSREPLAHQPAVRRQPRFLPDQDAVVNITYDDSGGDQNLRWVWSDDVDWKPQVEMTMDSDVANKYFQGKENAKTAVLRRRIKTGGDIGAALKLAPITEAVFPQYRAYLEREKPHLLV